MQENQGGKVGNLWPRHRMVDGYGIPIALLHICGDVILKTHQVVSIAHCCQKWFTFPGIPGLGKLRSKVLGEKMKV